MNFILILASISVFFSGALAFAVAFQQRRSVAHGAFVAGMIALCLENVALAFTAAASSLEEMVRWQDHALLAMAFLPGTWLLFSLTFSRGNHAQFVRKWRFVLAAAFLFPMGIALFFHSGLIASARFSPETREAVFGLNGSGHLLNLIFLVSSVLVLMNLERTFRAAIGTMRWRIKFILLGVAVLFAVRAYTSSQILLFHSVDLSLQAVNSSAALVASLLIVRSLLRPGHFDVSVYPSHSVLQNSLTLLLAGIYLVVVGLFANVVSSLGGGGSFTLKSFLILVALVLFTMVLLSDRVRMRTKRFVSRHFQRPIYDYRTTWRNFTEATASCVEQTELCRAVVKLSADIFQVLSVTLWLVDEKKEKLIFAASTSLSETHAHSLAPKNRDAAEVIQALQTHPEPIDIDSSKEHFAVALRRCHPDEFQKGGSRVCVPILMGGEVLGVMTLGDRVSGLAFVQQDFDLLKCISDQLAASLRNAQLSKKLLQAKELEAFQTMSAFFVHDLKNTASTLGLMLQNFSQHYDDPAFKQDALRGISKSVNHINDLIQRLTLFRREATMTLVEGDLNGLVKDVLTALGGTPNLKAVTDLQPLPKHRFDPDQMGKVLTNLLLNAKDASNGQGEIRIETATQNGWVALSVRDQGCGMTREFLEQSLFRPFQTTKKNGIGIGMFQSKMIIEAHGGKIEVETELGKGTTFRVLLPHGEVK